MRTKTQSRRGTARWRRVLTCLCCCFVGLLATAEAAAACNAGSRAAGRGTLTRGALVLGDSTMIFAAPLLGRLGLEADAQGCRQFGQGVAIAAARRRAGRLPRLVVLALGANGAVGEDGMRRALRTVGRRRVLGLVTPRNQGGTAAAMRRIAARHPSRVLLIDWARFSGGHGGWFGGDGLHVNHVGARAFARLVRRRAAGVVAPPVKTLKLPTTLEGAKACGVQPRAGRRLLVNVVRGQDRMTCRQARRLVRRAPLAGIPRWRWWDWSGSPPGPWTDVYRRVDGRVVVATVARD